MPQSGARVYRLGKRYSLGAEGHAGTRNSMPLFNLAWKKSFFWDGRAPSLRAQVLMPIQNPIEMHEDLAHVANKLNAAADYREAFQKVFGPPKSLPSASPLPWNSSSSPLFRATQNSIVRCATWNNSPPRNRAASSYS